MKSNCKSTLSSVDDRHRMNVKETKKTTTTRTKIYIEKQQQATNTTTTIGADLCFTDSNEIILIRLMLNVSLSVLMVRQATNRNRATRPATTSN